MFICKCDISCFSLDFVLFWVLKSYRFDDGCVDRIVVEPLLGDRALFHELGAMLVESLSMREDADLFVTEFVIANLAHHVIRDHQICLLKLIPLCSRVHSFDLRQSLRNLLVLLNGHLVVEHRL